MKFECPKCHFPNSPFVSVCANPAGCDFQFTLPAICGFYWRALLGRKRRERRPLTFECPYPRCHGEFTLKDQECPRCHRPINLTVVLAKYFAPLGKRVRDTLRSPAFQVAYVSFSLLLLGFALLSAEARLPEDWVPMLFLSGVYISFLTLVLILIVPLKYRVALTRKSPVLKLAFIFNYLSLVLLLEVVVTAWKTRATILGSAFLVSVAAFLFFLRVVYPVIQEMAQFFEPPPEDPQTRYFDPAADQGRSASHQHRTPGED